MRDLVLEGMRAGAIGFATSTSPAHNGHGGMPMPSRLADDARAARAGRLPEGGRARRVHAHQGRPDQDRVPRGAGGRTRAGRWSSPRCCTTAPIRAAVFDDLDAIAAGQRARPQAGRRDLLLPAVHGLHAALALHLRGPGVLEAGAAAEGRRLRGEAEGEGLSRRGARGAVAAGALPPVQRRVGQGRGGGVGERRTAEQHSIAELARAAGKDPLDFMLDLALAEDLDTVFNALLLNSDEAAVGAMLRHPASLVSLSDAGAHLTFFNDAGFGLHLLGHWVRERGVLTLEEAVRQAHQRARAASSASAAAARSSPAMPPTCCCSTRRRSAAARRSACIDLPGGHPRLTTPRARRARRLGERRARPANAAGAGAAGFFGAEQRRRVQATQFVVAEATSPTPLFSLRFMAGTNDACGVLQQSTHRETRNAAKRQLVPPQRLVLPRQRRRCRPHRPPTPRRRPRPPNPPSRWTKPTSARKRSWSSAPTSR